MKLIYFCDCCQEIVDEVDIPEDNLPEQAATLTEEEWESIMKMRENRSSQSFVSTLCPDCMVELGEIEGLGLTCKAVIN